MYCMFTNDMQNKYSFNKNEQRIKKNHFEYIDDDHRLFKYQQYEYATFWLGNVYSAVRRLKSEIIIQFYRSFSANQSINHRLICYLIWNCSIFFVPSLLEHTLIHASIRPEHLLLLDVYDTRDLSILHP